MITLLIDIAIDHATTMSKVIIDARLTRLMTMMVVIHIQYRIPSVILMRMSSFVLRWYITIIVVMMMIQRSIGAPFNHLNANIIHVVVVVVIRQPQKCVLPFLGLGRRC